MSASRSTLTSHCTNMLIGQSQSGGRSMIEVILTAAAATGCVLTWFLPQIIRWHRKNLRSARAAQQRFYSNIHAIVVAPTTPPHVRASVLRLDKVLQQPFFSWIVVSVVLRSLLGFAVKVPEDAEALLKQTDRMSDELRDAFTATCILGLAMILLRSPLCLLLFKVVARFSRVPSSQIPMFEEFVTSSRGLRAFA